MITQEQVHDLLHYDPNTGVLSWRQSVAKNVAPGDVAGHVNNNGYVSISINKRRYQAHRLIWLYVYGTFPDEQIDHVNRIRHDNRLTNLRKATHQQNSFNRSEHKNNTSGYKGVTWNKRERKYKAYISANGKKIHLGYFNDPKLAHQAYITAKSTLHVL